MFTALHTLSFQRRRESRSICPKSRNNATIITVDYTVDSKVGTYLQTGGSEKKLTGVCGIKQVFTNESYVLEFNSYSQEIQS